MTNDTLTMFFISGDKGFMDRIMEQVEQGGTLAAGITDVARVNDTRVSIAYDMAVTSLSEINKALHQFRVQQLGNSK